MKRSVFLIPFVCMIFLQSLSQKIDTVFAKQKVQPEFHIRSLTLPVVLISYGFIALADPVLKQLDATTNAEIKEDHPGFKTTVDNYLQYSPALAVYGLNALGIKGRNNFRDRTIILLMSEIFMGISVTSLKYITHQQRPNGSDYLSFPSGHTATAFAGAEFLRMEYNDVSPWIGYAGYALATATGILRMYNREHWLSNVIAGAGFGILATRVSYWLYPVVEKKLFRQKKVLVY